MEEVTLKDVLNVVLDVKQEMKEMKQELQQEMSGMQGQMNGMQKQMNGMQDQMNGMQNEIKQMNKRIESLEEGQKQILREQVDTREIVKIIVDKIGEIDRKLDAQAKDKCMFHKTLVGAKSN